MTCTYTLKQGTWVTYEPITKHQPGDWNFPARSHLILVFFAFTQFKPNLLLVPQKVTPRIITWNSYLYPRFIAPQNVTHRLKFTYTNVHSSIFTKTETTQTFTHKWLDRWSKASVHTTESSASRSNRMPRQATTWSAKWNESDPKRQTLYDSMHPRTYRGIKYIIRDDRKVNGQWR